MPISDRDFAEAKRELLRGIKGPERAARVRWMEALRAAGLSVVMTPRGIGAWQLEQAAHLRESDPEAWEMLVPAHRSSTAKFNERLAAAGLAPLDPVA